MNNNEPIGRFPLQNSVLISGSTGMSKSLMKLNIDDLGSKYPLNEKQDSITGVVELENEGMKKRRSHYGALNSSSRNDDNVMRYRQPKNLYQLPLDYDIENFTLPKYYHDSDEENTISASLKINFIFSSMNESELIRLVHSFEPCDFKSGEYIIKQGDVGDYFYVLHSGEVSFVVNGVKVGSTSEKGSSFGELALLYSCPRAASVIAVGEVNKLLRVDSRTFRHILRSQTNKSTHDKTLLLKGIPFLEGVTDKALTRLAHSMTPRIFADDEVLVKKGDIGDKFYVIQEGALICKDIEVGNKSFENLALGPGDYFG
jgi:cAMP-dependent protein kinase regulator